MSPLCQLEMTLLGLERRQLFRLLKAYRVEGVTGPTSKRRGRHSNRQKLEASRQAALALIREWYWDFGPTSAGREAARGSWDRRWSSNAAPVIEAGLWRDRTQRRRIPPASAAEQLRRVLQRRSTKAPRRSD
jgi:hypothetical protein